MPIAPPSLYMPTILAVESATDACSVALLANGESQEDFRLEPRRHTRLLLPMIDALLKKCEVDVQQLDAIAFSAGPGSFTGLRVSAGTVQGLAFAANCPVLSVSTLAVLAQTSATQQHLKEGTRVLASLDARMDEVYWGDYQVVQGLVEARADDRLLAPSSVTVESTASQPVVAVGSGWQYSDSFSMSSAPAVVDASLLPRAMAMLPLAERAWYAGMAVPPEQAVPRYLRENVAWK